MSEALLNIISNGVQAIGDRPGKVRVTLDAKPPKGMVTLLVEDSGCGIPPEHLQRIFDPFFTSKEVGRGTGLGLSIGYGIIEECGGGVRVESRPGQGSRFFIDLPLPQNDFAAHLKAGR
jgi:signal transduction histidine kinase